MSQIVKCLKKHECMIQHAPYRIGMVHSHPCAARVPASLYINTEFLFVCFRIHSKSRPCSSAKFGTHMLLDTADRLRYVLILIIIPNCYFRPFFSQQARPILLLGGVVVRRVISMTSLNSHDTSRSVPGAFEYSC